MKNRGVFRKELSALINKFSLENNSDTPDYVLANYLDRCLDAFDEATVTRDRYHNFVDANTKGPVSSSLE